MNRQQISFTDGEISHIWTPLEFSTEFGVEVPDQLVQLNYEPDRSLYCKTVQSVVGEEYESENFISPNDDNNLNWVHNNIADIRHSAEYHSLMANREYPNDDYTWDGSQWILVPAANRLEVDAQRWLEQNSIKIAIALSYLWEAAESKNVFQGMTIPTEVTNTVATIVANRDKV